MGDAAAVTFRPARADDAGQIAAIAGSAPEAAQWPDADYLAYDCRVAEAAGRVIGFVLSRQVADREFEILNTAVAPDFRRRGVALALLQLQLEQQQGRWFLEVRRSNSAARNLYKRLGFTEIGTRPGYYRDPPEPAIVMALGS